MLSSLLGAPLSAAGRALVSVAAAAAGSFLTRTTVELASWLLGEIARILLAPGDLNLGAAFFTRAYTGAAELAAALALPTLLLAVISTLRRGSVANLAETLLRVPVAFLGIGAAPAIVTLLARLIDAAAGDGLAGISALPKLAGMLQDGVGNPLYGPVVGTFLAGIALVGAALIYVELIGRDAAIYLALVMLPFTALGVIWPALGHWFTRTVKLIAGLLLVKLVLAAAIGLGAGAITGAAAGGAAEAAAGAALIIAGAFAPPVVLRVVGFSELALAEVAGSITRVAASRTASGAQRAVSGAMALPEWMEVSRLSSQPARLPWYAGYPPPSELVERAKSDPWMDEFLHGRRRSK